MSQSDSLVHLIAGGLGGTAGAIATCPLEVVKTRLQSSVATFHAHVPSCRSAIPPQSWVEFGYRPSELLVLTHSEIPPEKPVRLGIWRCIKYIVETEGVNALFKGLGPNLVGVAPSRAIYFCTYSRAKNFFNQVLTPDTAGVHTAAAVCAGLTTSTATNPIWLVKTRLQLDQRKNGSMTIRESVQRIYKANGIPGFYKGLTASYAGVSETVIHFVIYEALKAKLRQYRNGSSYDAKTSRDFLEYMAAGAFSKTVASCLAYPHEVARTRLRQEGNKYRGFWQTLTTIMQEEGFRGLYRGLATQLVRQIPNTAIMMATYELVIYMFSNSVPQPVVKTVDTNHLQFVTEDDDVK